MASELETMNSEAREARLPGVFVKTFGCQMNEYDSEKMLAVLEHSHRPVSRCEDAELVLVNTCSVREKGEQKLFSLLGSLRELKREKPGLVIGVGGCVAQQEGDAILRRNSSVDFVVGTHNLSLIPSLVSAVEQGLGPQVAVDYRAEWETLPDAFLGVSGDAEPAFGGVRALVAIQRGCNKRCSFCVVPGTRGPEVSRAPEEILREIRLKVRLGAREVLLLGQTVNSYGRDLSPRYPFERLIREVAAIDGVQRIRFISPHPAEFRPEFVQLLADVPTLVPHLHLPLQSGSDRLLQLMNRNYRMRRYNEIVEMLRSARSDIALTTDLIVGFPTETEEDFESTLEAVRRIRFLSAYTFMYSKRPNTEAARRFAEADEVPAAISHRRLMELQSVQEEISKALNSALLGKRVEVLLESVSPNVSGRGRTPHNTPIEVRGEGLKIGALVEAVVDRVTPFGLGGIVAMDSVRPDSATLGQQSLQG